MKKTTIILSAILMVCLPLKAQQLLEDSFKQLRVHYNTPALSISETVIDGFAYGQLTMDGYITGGEIGMPALPLCTSLLTVPQCKSFEVKVENAVYDTVQLPTNLIVMPAEPSISKSDSVRHKLTFNQLAYGSNNYAEHPLATVEYIGIARDRHLAQLTFSPVVVNPNMHKAIVCRSADITVVYNGSDEDATIQLFQRHYTPAYSIGSTFNNLISPKYVSNITPIRLAVLAPSSLRCNRMEEFLKWKREQGFRVDVFYIDEMGIQSASAIDNMLKGLYDNANDDNPAPAYLIIMGDVAQVPTHNSKLQSGGWYGPDNNHVTDLYYTTWTTGDKVPDCYFGRISATDTNMLGRILKKTIMYEKYNFVDDSYLARAALIAGVDQGTTGDNAYKYADPAMDYVAKQYVCSAQGYNDSIVYYKNNTSFAPTGVTVTGSSKPSSAATALRNFYNLGAGWINYTAHGNWDCWGQPELTVNHVNQMTNSGKPSFVVGSCCLTNKFEKGACLGEAFLRRGDDAGAIGYVGGSNSTYWSEDFYWAVGVRNSITNTMNATYDANNLGVYDRLFHTHGEAFTATATTAGKILMFGNVAVQNSSSSLKDYYWEIYHLMGDPTLMPWLGRAEEPYVVVTSNTSTSLHVNTIPGAYVAVVNPGDGAQVISATFADASGNATLNVPLVHSFMALSVSAQNHKHLYETLSNMGIGDAAEVHASVYPNPANSSCTVACPGIRSVQVINSLGQTIRTIAANGDRADIDLQGMNAGLYILRIATDNGVATSKLVVK